MSFGSVVSVLDSVSSINMPKLAAYTTGFVSKVGTFMMSLISEMLNQES